LKIVSGTTEGNGTEV